MNNYETLLIVRQEATASQVDSLADELVSLITEQGGELSRREYWGLRNLAYRIRKSRKGHYLLLNYCSVSGVVDSLQYRLRYSDDVLRYMTVRTDDLPTEPSVQMRQSSGGEDSEKRDTTASVSDKGYRRRRVSSDSDEDSADGDSEKASESLANDDLRDSVTGSVSGNESDDGVSDNDVSDDESVSKDE